MKRSALLIVTLIALALPASSQAAFPGQNGRIAFSSAADGDSEIYSINPNGIGLVQLTNNTTRDRFPSWSPDGQRIVFVRAAASFPSFDDVWTMNANGSGQTKIIDNVGPDATPSWSPDGQKIVFTIDSHCDGPGIPGTGGVFTANQDGSDIEWLACGIDDGAQYGTTWSPDGTRIVWTEGSAGPLGIWLKTIGGGTVNLRDWGDLNDELFPDWSPSGHKILYYFRAGDSPDPDGLYTMNPDGSAPAYLRSGGPGVWSPDGQKIAFELPGPPAGIWIANSNGSGATFLASDDSPFPQGEPPSWQPIPVNSYPRPKGASPARFPLVPAYAPCTTPNRTHGAPLSQPSCNPPVLNAEHTTLPTQESNGAFTSFNGHLLLRALTGDPATPADEADVALEVSAPDVRCSDANPPTTCGAANIVNSGPPRLRDYIGELDAVVFVRITDKDSTPNAGGPGAATVEDLDLHFTVPCTGTQSTQLGGNCTLVTTVEAVYPGAIDEGRRSVWELDRVHVRDGGADGDTATTGNRVLLRSGIFVP